jgi:transposase
MPSATGWPRPISWKDVERQSLLPAEAVLSASEREALLRLRREYRQLKPERDILSLFLSRATAWLARETGVLPSGSSGS